jgi:ferric-dicitrate binding protein FerR (iron transport regulator)
MSNREHSGGGASGGADRAAGNDSIAELMRLAGPRPPVPPHVQKRVHDAVQAEWRSTLRQRRTLRWGMSLALAASVLLAVALSSRGPEVRGAPIATVALAEGNADASVGMSPGDPVYPGDAIATGDGGLALTVRNGLSLRFDAGTTATFDSIGELTLQEGRIYADTGSSVYDTRSITVRTRVGSARDVGTRFAVAYADGDMSVAVREGRVDVSHSRGAYTADAGQSLKLGPGGDVVLDQISIYDSSWDWAAALAPAFDLENHSLLDFLKWVARETGKELVFENDATRLTAMGIRPRGSTEGFTPIEAIDSVLATTRLGYRVDTRQIVISDAAR